MAYVRTTFLLSIVLAVSLFMGCDNPANSDTAGTDSDDDPVAPVYTNTITINGSSYDITSVTIEEVGEGDQASSRIVTVDTTEPEAPMSAMGEAAPPLPAKIVAEVYVDQFGEIPLGTYAEIGDFVTALICTGTEPSACDLLNPGEVTVMSVSVEFGGVDEENVTVSGTFEFTYNEVEYSVTVSYDGEYESIVDIPIAV